MEIVAMNWYTTNDGRYMVVSVFPIHDERLAYLGTDIELLDSVKYEQVKAHGYYVVANGEIAPFFK